MQVIIEGPASRGSCNEPKDRGAAGRFRVSVFKCNTAVYGAFIG
jgi:hypothetical protein